MANDYGQKIQEKRIVRRFDELIAITDVDARIFKSIFVNTILLVFEIHLPRC